MRQDILQNILKIGISFSREKNKDLLLRQVAETAMDITGCRRSLFYLCPDGDRDQHEEQVSDRACGLRFAYMLTMQADGCVQTACKDADIPPLPPLTDRCVICSGSVATVLLVDDRKHLIGVLELVRDRSADGAEDVFCAEDEQVLQALSALAAICLSNIAYAQQIRDMLDSYIKVMSAAIDARTPYNANHTKNMVTYAKRFIRWMHAQQLPEAFDEKKSQEFLMSVWLHDIGKLITPLEIMDKRDRLAGNYARMMDRFERIRLLTRIERLEQKISDSREKELLGRIEEATQLVRQVNRTDTLRAEQEAAVRQLASYTYTEEDGSVCAWITPEETDQLLIRTGTLTASERAVMRDHVKQTHMMLEQMVFGDDYRHVIQWASDHHELLDGSGYPKGKQGAQLGMEVRLLTILDIFEAMTAKDRPYKRPVPASHAFELLHEMARDGTVDAHLLDLFEQSHAWESDHTQTTIERPCGEKLS